MTPLLRTLGFLFWIGCILVLAYQACYWVINATWPSITLLDGTQNLLGIDLAALIQNLPLEYAMKASYFFITTELSIAFWWIGVFFFGTFFAKKIIFGK